MTDLVHKWNPFISDIVIWRINIKTGFGLVSRNLDLTVGRVDLKMGQINIRHEFVKDEVDGFGIYEIIMTMQTNQFKNGVYVSLVNKTFKLVRDFVSGGRSVFFDFLVWTDMFKDFCGRFQPACIGIKFGLVTREASLVGNNQQASQT